MRKGAESAPGGGGAGGGEFLSNDEKLPGRGGGEEGSPIGRVWLAKNSIVFGQSHLHRQSTCEQ